MLVEYLALARLVHAVRGMSIRTASRLIAIPLVIAGPLSLIDPDRFYRDLLKPSLIALRVSQIMVVAVFPLFMRRRGASASATLCWRSVALRSWSSACTRRFTTNSPASMHSAASRKACRGRCFAVRVVRLPLSLVAVAVAGALLIID